MKRERSDIPLPIYDPAGYPYTGIQVYRKIIFGDFEI
jgi:hypothetical protein